MPKSLLGDFMSGSVLSVPADIPLHQVAEKMSEARVSCAVVCATDGQPLGVVSERDLTRAYARDLRTEEAPLVSSAMSQGVWTMTEEDSCDRAMQVMKERGIRRLVIVDKSNKLSGIVTQTDMLRAHAREVESQKSLLEERVAERTQELREVNARLESLSRIDPLMGIGNRRAMDDELGLLEQRAQRYKRPYAVALADVDYFKKFNDHYGHGPGDEVLKQVAKTMVSVVRAADSVYRYGGEELLIIFPEIGQPGARVAAQHVCDGIAALNHPHELSPFEHLTVSIGVAEEDMMAPSWEKTVARADSALYIAKHSGRNCVADERSVSDEEVAA